MSPVDPRVAQAADAVLQHHGKTFAWAARGLPPRQRTHAAVAYAFCRFADDAVDEAPDVETAHARLADLEAQLAGERAADPLVTAWRQVAQTCGIAPEVVTHLLNGMRHDLHPVAIADDVALLTYAYQVAGVVGLLMCGVLDVTDPAAYPHAIDLGLGMQLTNICRDVAEDAARGRVYLPATRLAAHGATPADVLAGRADAAERAVVAELLDLADRYYASGRDGLHYLPQPARQAIAVAGRLYQEIGHVLRERGCATRQGRVFVTGPRKAARTAQVLAETAVTWTWAQHSHDVRLHAGLEGLPGTSGLVRS